MRVCGIPHNLFSHDFLNNLIQYFLSREKALFLCKLFAVDWNGTIRGELSARNAIVIIIRFTDQSIKNNCLNSILALFDLLLMLGE